MNLLVPIIFIGLMIISAISKMREQKNLAERKKGKNPTIKPEDLPEATRRMLYGTSEAPKPQTQRGAAPVRVAKPRQGQPAQRQGQPVQRQAQPVQRQTPPPRAPQTVRREALQTSPRSREARVTPPSPQAALQARQRAQHEAQQRAKQEAQQLRAKQVAEAKARALAAKQRRQAPEAAPAARRPAKGGLFADLDDFRRGIVMSEILGKPKSMRENS